MEPTGFSGLVKGVVLIKKEPVTIRVGEVKVKANSVTKEESTFEEQLS